MQYLVHDKVPKEKAEELWVKRAATFLRLDDEHELWVKNPLTAALLYVSSTH